MIARAFNSSNWVRFLDPLPFFAIALTRNFCDIEIGARWRTTCCAAKDCAAFVDVCSEHFAIRSQRDVRQLASQAVRAVLSAHMMAVFPIRMGSSFQLVLRARWKRRVVRIRGKDGKRRYLGGTGASSNELCSNFTWLPSLRHPGCH